MGRQKVMRGEVPCREELGAELEERMEKRRKEWVAEQGAQKPPPPSFLPSCLAFSGLHRP